MKLCQTGRAIWNCSASRPGTTRHALEVIITARGKVDLGMVLELVQSLPTGIIQLAMSQDRREPSD